MTIPDLTLTIEALLVGTPKPYGPKQQPSAIDKKIVCDSIEVSATGLAGDAQGDTRHHGGPEKAVHHYPRDHYADWIENHPDMALRLQSPGAFGENISLTGLREDNVCIGDIWRLGTACVQVSQGRQPCWKLNVRFNRPDMARLVQKSGRTGWYYRVLEPGAVGAGDRLSLVERPLPDWPLTRLHRILYVTPDDWDALEQMAELEPLSSSWRKLAATRLAKRETEDWRSRLHTPE